MILLLVAPGWLALLVGALVAVDRSLQPTTLTIERWTRRVQS